MNILTFDLEDWFHILDINSSRDVNSWNSYPSRINKNMDMILEILKEHNQKATFFCLGWIAEKNPQLIKRIVSNGFELGSHSYSHQLIYEQNPDVFKKDLNRSVSILEDLSGIKIKYFRAPGFSIRKDCLWAFEILAETGIEIDCSLFPAPRSHGGIPSFIQNSPALINYKGCLIKEFPVNIKKIYGKKIVFSGGGYFRFFPYWLIRKMAEDSDYLMTYFHPRDFDPEQPRLNNLNPIKYFKTYIGLSGAKNKICSLLRDFSFTNVSEASNSIDWNLMEIVKY
jgi:peptidoglycan-N-acetylglucosamine deacetylase